MSGGEKFDNPAYNADLQNGHSSKGAANGADVVIENGDKFPKSSKVSPSESGSDGGEEKKEKEEEQKTVGVGELVSLPSQEYSKCCFSCIGSVRYLFTVPLRNMW